MKFYFIFIILFVNFNYVFSQGIFDIIFRQNSDFNPIEDRKQLEKQIKDLSKEKYNLTKNLEDTKQKANQSFQTLQTYKIQTENIRQQNIQLTQKNKELQSINTQLSQDKQNLESENQRLRNEIEKLKEEISVLKEEIKRLNNTIDTKNNEIKTLRDSLNLYKSNLDSIRQEFFDESFELLASNDQQSWYKIKLIQKEEFKQKTDRSREIYEIYKAKKIKTLKIRIRRGREVYGLKDGKNWGSIEIKMIENNQSIGKTEINFDNQGYFQPIFFVDKLKKGIYEVHVSQGEVNNEPDKKLIFELK
ncbi:MAG: hypothetical protein EAZ85_12340 [Bacteroidetes bacterium]|nr:MAG: hypothetical protein EAZ85_12340 [Bacteroidota bacterium]TAG86117.1 MAG: hypothetical protein EAZ20_13465 [Bacteroidota bacterium]